jgi:hypothetical protein
VALQAPKTNDAVCRFVDRGLLAMDGRAALGLMRPGWWSQSLMDSIQFLYFCICFLCCAQVVYVLVGPRYNLYLGQEKSIYISVLQEVSGVSGVSGV